MFGKDKTYITVFIRLHNGNGLPFTLNPSSPFYKLIDMLHRTPLQLPPNYTILHHGTPIQHYDYSLKQLHIFHNSILHIEQPLQPQKRSYNMDVCICLDDQFFIVKAKPTETIKQLKQTIHKLMEISPKHQILIFCGQVLNNSNTLIHYKIHPNSLISLISTAKKREFSEVLSDYDNIANTIIKKQKQMLDSVLSLGEQRTASSKIALFRSDSIDKKNVEELPPIQITPKQLNFDQNSSIEDDEGKQFNFHLFKSLGLNPTPMTLSVDNFNNFKCKLKKPDLQQMKKIAIFQSQQSSIQFDAQEVEDQLDLKGNLFHIQ